MNENIDQGINIKEDNIKNKIDEKNIKLKELNDKLFNKIELTENKLLNDINDKYNKLISKINIIDDTIKHYFISNISDNNNRGAKIKNEKKNENEKNIFDLKKKLEEKDSLIKKNQIIIENYKKENNDYKNKINEYDKKINEIKKNKNNQDINYKQELEKQKEIFENNKKVIKEEIEKNLNEKYENNFKKEIKNIQETFNKKLQEKIEELKEVYRKKYENKDKEMNDKYNEIKNLIEKIKINQKNKDNNNLNSNKLTIIHNGIKCEKCFQLPIIGYRYKCSKCNDYNLCEKCVEKNYISEEHPHDFIIITKEKKNLYVTIANNNNDNNILDELDEIKEINKVYSYECVNIKNLITNIYEGDKEAKIKITLKNNGNEDWPEGSAKLVFDSESHFSEDDIILKPQKTGEQKSYDINFKKLGEYTPNEYKSYLWFNVNGNSYGEKLTLIIKINEKRKYRRNREERENQMENNDKIKEFREKFDLGKTYNDSKLLNALKKNNFNYEKAFESLFN